ncbi:putative proteasome subunit beta type-3, partial [Neolecta irregularis DAH-3]
KHSYEFPYCIHEEYKSLLNIENFGQLWSSVCRLITASSFNLHTKSFPIFMSIFEYNGGAVLAMVGKDCVAIASDMRLGQQAMTISNEFPKLWKANDKVWMGLTGLATDVITLKELMRFKLNMYRLVEEREIEPTTYANLISSTLYEKRFGPYFVNPLIAGLDRNNKPFICGFDSIGCIDFAKTFVVAGTATEQLYGMCEGLYEPGLEPEDLFETISQCLLNAQDRDALSGWGAMVVVISKKGVEKRLLKGRQD